MGMYYKHSAEPLFTGNVFVRGNQIFGIGGKIFVDFNSDRLGAVKHNIFVVGKA